MRNSLNRNPLSLVSEFKGPRLLNFAGEGGGAAASQGSDPDEPAADTPAGKKWAALREKARIAEEERAKERDARLKAEAKAEAFEEFKQSFGNAPKKGEKEKDPLKPEVPADVNPEDHEYVGKSVMAHLQRLGLDKIPEVVEALQKNTQQITATTTLDRAKQELTAEFKDSVPFNYEEALTYAKERGFGLVAGTVKDALKLAHKELNEQKFIEFWKGGSGPKKQVPKMVHSGGGAEDRIEIPEPDADIKVESFEDARVLARKQFEGEV